MKRKAIKFADTYVVSLPLSWSRRFGIDKNRELEMEETEKGELIISGQRHPEETEATITVSRGMGPDRIFYKVQKQYLIGVKKIRVRGITSSEQFTVLSDVRKKLMGLEVTDQKGDEILFSDILRIEDIDISKHLSSMFSFLEIMADDIIVHIKKKREPGDILLERDSAVDREHNIIYRCCNLAMKDSHYLRSTGKTTNQLVAIARIIKNLEFLGNILIAMSYMINTSATEGMNRYFFKVHKRDDAYNKIILGYMEKWLSYFKQARRAVIKSDPNLAAELYIKRFDYKLKIDYGLINDGHISTISSIGEHLNRETSAIMRELMVL
jgi:phosphate uptake regulator